MSRIYWHSQSETTSELLGSERAYMGVTCDEIAATVIRSTADPHPLTRLLPDGATLHRFGTPNESAAMYLRSFISDNQLIFGGRTYSAGDLVLNTICAIGSPTLALMAKLHGYCESHAWVAEEDREWLAGVIGEAVNANILRRTAGWESVASHLMNGDGGPVVTSYSVCDQFPSMDAADWMDEAWPAEQRGVWDYDSLTAQQKEAIEQRQEDWYDLPWDARWDKAFAGITGKWWLRISPETLMRPSFGPPATLWDAVASEEWRA